MAATPAPTLATPADPAPTPTPPATATMDLPALKQLWPAVLSTLGEQHQLLHGVIAPAVPIALDGHELTLAYPESEAFFRRKAENAAHRATLAEVVRTLAGFQPRLRFELVDAATLGSDQPPEPVVSEAEWIERFKTEFDAQEIDPDPEES